MVSLVMFDRFFSKMSMWKEKRDKVYITESGQYFSSALDVHGV